MTYKKRPIVNEVSKFSKATNGVDIIKRINPATKRKRYTPVVRGKALRLSWTTRTHAEAYGSAILNRYVAKLALLAASIAQK